MCRKKRSGFARSDAGFSAGLFAAVFAAKKRRGKTPVKSAAEKLP